MMSAAITPVSLDVLENEFIPPIEALQSELEAWGVPWDRQLDVVRAWQDAGGNTDSEWEQWVSEQGGHADALPSHAMDASSCVPTMATVVRMTTALVSLRERLFSIQSEATSLARVEMELRCVPLPEAANGSGPTSIQRPLGADNGCRVLTLVRGCADLLESARVGIASLAGVGVASVAERRRQRVLIDFPDRRAAT